MGCEVRYEDAVALLGGDKAKMLRLLDTLLGARVGTPPGSLPDVLEWSDAETQLSELTERLVRGLCERRSTLRRYERTERLQAAHAVLAMTAFVQAVAGLSAPALTPEALRFLGKTHVAARHAWYAPVPGPAESHEDFRDRLAELYQELAKVVGVIVAGKQATARVFGRPSPALDRVPDAALLRYDSAVGRLAAAYPEVGFWAGMREKAATHARLGDVTTGVAALKEILERIAAGQAPDDRRRAIARAYAANLRRPIVESGEVPAGLKVPALGEAFLPQRHRVVTVSGQATLSSEDWWEEQPVRDDLLAFLTGYLTCMTATKVPLLLLGQPGSGKSVLAKVLAGQLPPADFLPVLVLLRVVPAAADLQDQIERAIRIDTGDRVAWPALARSAGDALPVVILDGFDELLQATGVSQTDYLQKVAAFQAREADQGRPVAVIVTSRTSVADRAKAPDDTIAVRLEPFDESRVDAWLAVWNRANADRFASGPDRPLDLETVMRYPDLAAQPLLLLMLALYDAEGNALREAGALRTDQLYERLLERFARREVDKLGEGLPARERAKRVEGELRKLSQVAFAMFNRGAQWVGEAELDADLLALPRLAEAAPARVGVEAGLRAPLRAAELALGSFFFVHRARASRDDIRLETYEFLHATFGEFLVARLIHGVVRDLIAKERVSSFPSGGAVDDDLLHALLSFAPLAGRRQAVDFVREMVGTLPAPDRDDWADLLLRLLRAALMPRPPRAYDDYTPRLLSVPSRIAAYTANLLVLALCPGPLTASRVFDIDPGADPDGDGTIDAWQDLAHLWHSQARASGWQGLLDLVAVRRVWAGRRRDVELSHGDPATAVFVPVDLGWVLGSDAALLSRDADRAARLDYGAPLEEARREAHFTCDAVDDLLHHEIDPLRLAGLQAFSGQLYRSATSGGTSSLPALLTLLLGTDRSADERRVLFTECTMMGLTTPMWSVLLRRLGTDTDMDAELVVTVVGRAPGSAQPDSYRIDVLRCLTAHSTPSQELLTPGDYLSQNLLREAVTWTEWDVEAAIRLAELGMRERDVDGTLSPTITAGEAERLLERYAVKRPDFVSRIGILVGGAVDIPSPEPE